MPSTFDLDAMAPARTTQAITFVFLGLLFTASNAFSDAEFVLYSDPSQSLLPGQKLVYDMTPHGIPFGPHELSFQRDCNLTLYTNTSSIWSANTSLVNDQDCYLTLLPEGEVKKKITDLKFRGAKNIQNT